MNFKMSFERDNEQGLVAKGMLDCLAEREENPRHGGRMGDVLMRQKDSRKQFMLLKHSKIIY